MAYKRAIFPRRGQQKFLEQVYKRLDGQWDEVAKLCVVHRRTLFDWRREKYTISAAALGQIRNQLHLEPKQTRLVNGYRHVRKAGHIGAQARYRIYGNPGTQDGRRRGGFVTQRFFGRHPALALRAGFQVRRPIRHPTSSQKLAEFIGLMLGDGHLGSSQVALYFNRRTERQLAVYVKRLAAGLFGVSASLRVNDKNCLAVVISSKALTEWLPTVGLSPGNKLANHANIPEWIFQRARFMEACLRGLIDTDGSVFFHTHTVQNHRYRHIGVSFTSYSTPLLHSVARLMKVLGYHPRTYPKAGHLYLYRRDEINRYMREVGTRNPNHLSRFQSYRSSSAS